jgi:hypothetical protein
MFLVLLSYLASFSIALPDSMLGVAWPTMRISFQQPISAAGLVPPLGVAATLVSTTAPATSCLGSGLGGCLPPAHSFLPSHWPAPRPARRWDCSLSAWCSLVCQAALSTRR